MEHLEWFSQAQNGLGSDSTDVPTKLSDTDREIFDAASRGDHVRLHRLLQPPPDSRTPQPSQQESLEAKDVEAHANLAKRINGFNALLIASHKGHTEVVRALLSHASHASRSSTDTRTRTSAETKPRSSSTSLSSASEPPLLLTRTADGRSAAHLAAAQGHADLLELLINAPIDMAVRDGEGGRKGEVEDEGGDGDADGSESRDVLALRDNAGRSVLHAAAHSGDVRCIQMVCEAQVRPRAGSFPASGLGLGSMQACTSDAGVTSPAAAAAAAAAPAPPRACRVDVRAVTLDGQSAAHVAAARGALGAVRYLCSVPGIDPTAATASGQRLLHKAAFSGAVDLTRYLCLECAATGGMECLGAVTTDGFTALHIAASQGHADVVEFLLSVDAVAAGAAACSQSGQTPLHKAAFEGHLGVVKLLLANGGVSVDARDKEGKTPLMMAANGGAEATCVFLVEHAGACITAVDDSGATAADMALKTGYKELARRLNRLCFIHQRTDELLRTCCALPPG